MNSTSYVLVLALLLLAGVVRSSEALSDGQRDSALREREALQKRLAELDGVLGAPAPETAPAGVHRANASSATGAAAIRSSEDRTLVAALAAGGGVGIGLVVALIYFLIVVPLRRRRPYVRAIRLIERDEGSLLEEAEKLLSEAVNAGLRPHDLARARFALAFVLAARGQYEDAASLIAEIERSNSIDPETVYLGMYIYSRLGHHDQVERLYETHEETVKDVADARFIASLAYLRRGQEQWARRQISEAVVAFDRVRELEVLAEQLPEGIGEYLVTLGVVALFDNDLAGARQHFRDMLSTAEATGVSTVPGRLGLLLCDWKEQEQPRLDEALGEVIRELPTDDEADVLLIESECPHCSHSAKGKSSYAGQRVTCPNCRRGYVISKDAPRTITDEGSEPPPVNELMSDADRLKRNVLLWHMVTYLMSWLDLAVETNPGLDRIDELARRGALVKEIDADIPDAGLILGLIRYYFAEDDQLRREAVGELERLDANLPELRDLIDREKKAAEKRRNALEQYLVLLRGYLTDPEVPIEARREIKIRCEKFSRFRKELGSLDDEQISDEADQSIGGLHHRADLIAKHVSRIHTRLTELDPEYAHQVEDLVETLREQNESLSKNAKEVQKTECRVMVQAAEGLLRDEYPDEDGVDPSDVDNGPTEDISSQPA